jgi:hypothetical protein
VTQSNDQVFQLSLTEIAFTIAFILLLLLGYLVVKEQIERKAAEAELAKVQSSERATQALDAAREALRAALQGTGVGSPDEVVTRLVAAEDARAERDRLKKQVEDLDAKLTALEELRKRLEEAASSSRPGIARDEVSAALALQDQVRKALEEADTAPPPARQPTASAPLAAPSGTSSSLDTTARRAAAASATRPSALRESSSKSDDSSKTSRDRQRDAETLARVRQAIAATGEFRKQLKAQLNRELAPGKETETVRDVVAAAKGYGELAKAGVNPEQIRKENSDLRGQVAFLKNRLDARGGRDYPPCWADESGKVEFLFAVEVKPDLVVVTAAWPPRREAASHLPGMAEVLAGPHSNQQFVNRIQGIFNWSKSQDPECRHYVQLKSSISDAVQSDRARLMVENFFYKTEVRR